MATNSTPFKSRIEKRSPFPRRSLPQAGESLRDAIQDLIFDKSLTYAFVAVAFAAVAVIEFLARWLGHPLSPWNWVFASGVSLAWAIWRGFAIKPQVEQLVQGMRGEREIGRMLEGLRALGYEVFHDIPGERGNIDHALIGPGGIFAIETKAASKPGRGPCEVSYDGTQVLVNGVTPERNPVVQAQACAKQLREIICRRTGHEVSVRAVVLYPRWYVSKMPKGCAVWVLNEPGFVAFIKNEPASLSREDIALYASRLTDHLSPEDG